MVDYIEVKPIPEVCRKCMETQTDGEECYNCDYALERWQLLSKIADDKCVGPSMICEVTGKAVHI